MNLFIAAWNAPERARPQALAALKAMETVYPRLETGAGWQACSGAAWAAGILDQAPDCPKRRYVSRTGEETLFFEGCPVDRTGRFWAFDAANLAARWDSLPEALEGPYVIARMGEGSARLALITDFIGLCQVYYRHVDEVWWISNSAGLISSVCGATEFDPLGISLALTVGWAGADRTLMRDIRVIPPGSIWKWRDGSLNPIQEQHFRPRRLLQPARKSRFSRPDAIRLRDELTGLCRRLSDYSGSLSCPVTGGRDSRVLVSLMRHGAIRGRYFTEGVPDSSELEISSRLAREIGLPHAICLKNAQAISEAWESASGQLIRQNDGMVSLWQVADIWEPSATPDNLGLWGIGGEIARGNFSNPLLFIGPKTAKDISRFLSNRVIDDHGGLVRKETCETVRDFLGDWVDRMSEEGFPPVDLPDLFYLYERIRRWGGSNARKTLPVHEQFSPFCTRAFVEEAFRLPAAYRYSEPLHFQLLHLDPVLHAFPFIKEPWRPQRPPVNMVSAVWRKRVKPALSPGAKDKSPSIQSLLLERRWSYFRESCLDRGSSPVWDYIDRGRFETLMSGRPDSRILGQSGLPIFMIVTLFGYERIFLS